MGFCKDLMIMEPKLDTQDHVCTQTSFSLHRTNISSLPLLFSLFFISFLLQAGFFQLLLLFFFLFSVLLLLHGWVLSSSSLFSFLSFFFFTLVSFLSFLLFFFILSFSSRDDSRDGKRLSRVFGLMSFELYNSVFITQNSKIVRPTQSMLFHLVFELSFQNSKKIS